MEKRITMLERLDEWLYSAFLSIAEWLYQNTELTCWHCASICFFAAWLFSIEAVSEAWPGMWGKLFELIFTLIVLAKIYYHAKQEQKFFEAVNRDVLGEPRVYSRTIASRKFNVMIAFLSILAAVAMGYYLYPPFGLLAFALPFALASSYFESMTPEFFYKRQLERRKKFGYEPFDF